MTRYICNITLACEEELLEEVLYCLRARLLPAWRSYEGLAAVRLLRLPERAGYALHLESEREETIRELDLMSDPELGRLLETYPGRVLPFATLLEVLD